MISGIQAYRNNSIRVECIQDRAIKSFIESFPTEFVFHIPNRRFRSPRLRFVLRNRSGSIRSLDRNSNGNTVSTCRRRLLILRIFTILLCKATGQLEDIFTDYRDRKSGLLLRNSFDSTILQRIDSFTRNSLFPRRKNDRNRPGKFRVKT